MLLRIVSILFPLFAIAAIGYLVGRGRQLDLSHANQLNMEVFVPALVFAGLANKGFHVTQYLPLAFATLILVFAGGAIGWALARALKVAPKTFVPPIMFNNCGNLGLPLGVLAFGDQALAPTVVMFMVTNLLHFSFGAWLLDRNVQLKNLWRVPTVLAGVAGLAVSTAGVGVWPPLMTAIRMLGDISIPLMLFALGVRMTDSRMTSLGLGVIGAVARPLIGMGLAWLCALALPMPPDQQAMLLVFGALPPAVLNYIFAERYHQEADKVASIVLIGHLASLLFLPFALALTLKPAL